MARKKTAPPVRNGAKITYVPEGESPPLSDKTDYEAQLVQLYLGDDPVDEVTADQASNRFLKAPVSADVRLSDGTELSRVPGFRTGQSAYWSRPWISSFRAY